MKAYDGCNAEYFNPQKDDWKPEDAQNEANHLINDEIILFPITDETFATGSLAETGFSIMQAIRSNSNRFVVIMITPDVDPALHVAAPAQAKDSVRARAIINAHLKKVNHPNVFIVDSLETMLNLSLDLYTAVVKLDQIRKTYRV